LSSHEDISGNPYRSMSNNVPGLPARPKNRAVRSHRPVHATATAPEPQSVRDRDSPKWANANGGGNLQLQDVADLTVRCL